MSHYKSIITSLLLHSLLFVALHGETCLSQESQPQSPKMLHLLDRILQGDREAIPEFWDNLPDGTPLVEISENETQQALVTFLWKGDQDTKNVQLVGGRPSSQGHPMLQRVANSDLWYLTQEMHQSSRGSYAFRVNIAESESTDIDDLALAYANSPPRPDPNNTRRSMIFSIFELPGAPPQPWIKKTPNPKKGKVTNHIIKSSHLNQTRSFLLYEPHETSDAGSNNLLIFFDAAYYTTPELVPTATILDNLIAANEIGPTTAVFVRNLAKPGSRERDLAFSEDFGNFVAKELIPWVQNKSHVSRDPDRTVACGVSLGGLAAAFCGLRHSDVIGGVLAQSGSFALTPDYPVGKALRFDTPTNWMAREFASVEKLPLRFYLEVGLFERVASSYGADMVLEQRRLRDVLRAKGYDVQDSEYHGGHDYVCHRGSLANGLIALLKQRLDQPQ